MTPLLKDAERRGLRIADGLGMLLHQAVPGFELWFGVRPKVTAELRALVARDLLFSIPPEAKFSVRFLKRPTFWIQRTAFMVEFFCYTEVGAKMLHTDGIRRYKLPSRRSPLRLLRLIQS